MFGAIPVSDGLVEFRVWAPNACTVSVRLRGADHELEPGEDGNFAARVPAAPGDDYGYVLGDKEWPDPWSRWQPVGVLGPSRVVDTSAFEIRPGPQPAELVIYELHVGTFSAEGTFDGAIPRLPELREAGMTAIEVMPIATFPGNRGWGYDGLYAYAPHPAYGGPGGFAQLVDAAHAAGLGVILDVVYNHVGPGDEAIAAFGPFFTTRHETPWGKAIDYSHRAVREWAIQNAELWVRDYAVDGLRLDAVWAIVDESRVHVLEELRERVPEALLISEAEIGDHRPVGEWGHDAQWSDEFHHALHVLLTAERDGYYADFGRVDQLARAFGRPEGERLVVCCQNHDQIGNRAVGDRLTPEQHRLGLAATLFSRSTPLVFQGEEYGETRPFQFFSDHVDPLIADATREGRRREFERFAAFAGEVPDPQAEETFLRSKLDSRPPDAWFRELVALRRGLPDELETEADEDARRLVVRRGRHTLTLDFANLAVELT
jgi:maltooligosyltrehalose trehalohydrolase